MSTKYKTYEDWVGNIIVNLQPQFNKEHFKLKCHFSIDDRTRAPKRYLCLRDDVTNKIIEEKVIPDELWNT